MLTVDLNTLDLKPGDRILDLGCGEGRHVHAFYNGYDVHAVGLDLSHKDIKVAREKVELFSEDQPTWENRSSGFSVGDATKLPFPDNSFDKIVCSEVLEHIPDYQSVLKEINRLLKPGGMFVASVPRFVPEWLCWKISDQYPNQPGGHIRIFTSGQLKGDVERVGFKRFRRHWAHGLHSPYWWLRCMFYDTADENPLVQAYHKLLVWDIMERPFLTRFLEAIAAPLMGKSVVMYFIKTA